MPDGLAYNILLLLLLLQVKHFICDGPLQTSAMVHDKGHYGRWLGIVHAGIHGIGALVTIMFWGVLSGTEAGVLATTAVLLALLDFALHYHIDFSKEQLVRRAGWTTANPQFWWALSADQALHQSTYLLIAAIAFTGV